MTAAFVYYHSFYGSTRSYAEALAQRLGVSAQELPAEDQGIVGMIHTLADKPTTPLIVLAPLHGPVNRGAQVLKQLDLGERPTALAAVGMTLIEEQRAKDPAAELLGGNEHKVTRFYLPGRLNYAELNRTHRTIMVMLVRALKLKARKSENDKAMIAGYGADVDKQDLTELGPILDWVTQHQ